MRLKPLLLLISILISFKSISQEINIGGNIGFIPNNDSPYISYGGSFEFRPNEAVMSYSADPFLIYYNNKFTLTAPVYLKYIIGNKLRICPLAGAFIRTNANCGFLYGIDNEYIIKNKFLIFVKADRYLDNWTEEFPSHSGGTFKTRRQGASYLISIGIKKMIK